MTRYPTISCISPPGISLFTAEADYIITNTKWSHIQVFVFVSVHVRVVHYVKYEK